MRQKEGPPDSGGGRVIWWPSDLRFEAKISKLSSLLSDPRMNPKGYILITSQTFFCINMYPVTNLDKCLDYSLTYQLVLVYGTKPFSVVVV